MTKPSRWTLAWLSWLALFVAIEVPAAIKRKGATFSEHVWAWFGIRTRDKGHKWKRVVLASFLMALSLHLVADTSSIPVAVGGAAVLWVIGTSVRASLSSKKERFEEKLNAVVVVDFASGEPVCWACRRPFPPSPSASPEASPRSGVLRP